MQFEAPGLCLGDHSGCRVEIRLLGTGRKWAIGLVGAVAMEK